MKLLKLTGTQVILNHHMHAMICTAGVQVIVGKCPLQSYKSAAPLSANYVLYDDM